MKWSPPGVVLDPKDAPDFPAIGEPKKDMWAVHRVVGETVYVRQVKAYGYVILFTEDWQKKGILWVDRREHRILCSCEGTAGPAPGEGITLEEILRHVAIEEEPKLELIDGSET